MKDKALNTILEYGMFSRGDRLLVACSGGADSVCLLHFLCGLRKSWDIKVSAIHLNHNLRGDESVRDENFVRELCTNWDVPLTVLTADIAALAKQAGESAELCGRRVRYEMFGQKAASLSAKLAVAHTLDDNAETVLLNLIRGTGLRGLGGIPPVRGDIVRPLIRCARTDVEAYLEAHGLSYVTDSTNATDAYTRNRVRKNIMPLLAAENPRFLGHMDGMTRQIREDADFLDGLAEEAAKSIIRDTGRYDRAGFLALPGPVSSRVLAGILKCAGITCERDTISRLFSIIEAGSGGEQLSREIIFRCGENGFGLCGIAAEQPFFSLDVSAAELARGGKWEPVPGKWVESASESPENKKNTQVFNKKGLTYRLDCDKIKKIVTMRQKLPADRLRPPGRGVSKTLKNLFQENGVSSGDRLRRIVLADEDGPILVEELGVDERAAVTDRTRNILTVEITEEYNASGHPESFV